MRSVLMGPVRIRQEPGHVVASKDGIGKLQQHWDMVDGIGI
jgi:hypothetical protein